MKIPKCLREDFREGLFDDEESLVTAIKDFLMTEKDWDILRKNHLSIQDILNGNFSGEQYKVVETLFLGWNKKLGFGFFIS